MEDNSSKIVAKESSAVEQPRDSSYRRTFKAIMLPLELSYYFFQTVLEVRSENKEYGPRKPSIRKKLHSCLQLPLCFAQTAYELIEEHNDYKIKKNFREKLKSWLDSQFLHILQEFWRI